MPITFLDEEDNTGIDDASLIPSIQTQKRKVTFLDEEPEEEVGTLQGISNSAQNAFDSSRQALLAVGGVDKDQAEQISKLEYAKQARKVSPDYAEYQKAEGWDAVGAFLKNPVEVTTNLIGEGLAGSLPALGAGVAAGAAGAAVGSVVPVIGPGIGYTAGQVAGTFGGSLSTEYGSKILEELQNSGMDITDPNSIQSYFSDEEKLAPIRQKALARGVPVAAFDAVSAGIGGKLGRVFGSEIIKEGEKVIGKQFATKTGEALTELGAQAILGGGGEVAGSIAAGDKVNLKDVFAEVIGEVGPGSIEVIQGKIADRANQRKLTEAKANQNILNFSEKLEQNNAPLTAQATTQELAKQLSDDLNADREKEAVELADLGGQTLKKINEIKAETQTATTKEDVASTLSEEDLNAREQDAKKLVQQYKDAFFESQDPNDRAKAVEFQGVLNAIQAEKQKRKGAPIETATIPITQEVITPTTKGITEFPTVSESETLPVEQAPLTQQAVAQQIEKQPYATEKIIQPKGVREEPKDRIEIKPTEEAGVGRSILGAARGEEKGQVAQPAEPIISEIPQTSEIVGTEQTQPIISEKLKTSELVSEQPTQPTIREVPETSPMIGAEPAAIVEQEQVVPITTPVEEAPAPAVTEEPATFEIVPQEVLEAFSENQSITERIKRDALEKKGGSLQTYITTSVRTKGVPKSQIQSITNKILNKFQESASIADIEEAVTTEVESIPIIKEKKKSDNVKLESALQRTGETYDLDTAIQDYRNKQIELEQAQKSIRLTPRARKEERVGARNNLEKAKQKLIEIAAKAPATAVTEEAPALTEAVAPIQRDATKPEQMTPKEFIPIGDPVNQGIYKTKDEATERLSRMVETIRNNKAMSDTLSTYGLLPEDAYTVAKTKKGKWSIGGTHKHKIAIGVLEKNPVSAAAVEAYNITLPEGYTKKGDLYVYQPVAQIPAAPAVTEKASVAATIENTPPTKPQIGQRVRSGSTPQPFVITEITPQTARDVELGEQYYKIKNERTGEESVVESVDITPIKTTRSSKKLKAVYSSKASVEPAVAIKSSKAVTPQMDRDYISAVESGDMKTAQRMVDEAAKAAGYNIGPVYHGTKGKKKGVFPFVIFDTKRIGKNTAAAGTPVGSYFAESVDYARGAANIASNFGRQGKPAIGAFYLKDAKRTPKVETAVEYYITDPSQAKSADPVTYNDAGNVIPLSQRFDQKTFDIRYARARDKAKYKQEYKSIAIQEKVQNYIKIAQDEMQEAIDNGDTNLAKNIQESIDTAKGYNINESELYSEKELESGVRNFFKGSIPNNVIFTNDIGSDSYASYNLETGEIEINRAYFKSNVNIDAIIGHELGHFAFGDPEFQKILTSFWDGLTQEQNDAISKYVEENYSSFNADLKNEEKVIQAWQSLLEENPEIRSAWKNFVELVKRFFNKYFSTKFEVNDSDKFVLNVLNSIRQEFINGRKIVREDGSDFKLQAKAQVHGQKEAGRELESFVGGEKIVQDIVRQNYFDSTKFNDENTQKAYDLLQLLTDFTNGNNNDFVIKLNENIQSKLKDQNVHPDIKQVIGVQILRNELQRYSNKLMQNGDFLFEKKYKLNANDIPLGIKDVNTSNIARALSAIARINNPMLGAFEAQTKGEIAQVASTTFGTKTPSVEQIKVIEDALTESSKAETIDNSDILDSVVSAESKTGVNIRKDIDATIKKSGVKQKTVDDIIGSTETGKTEFSGVETSKAKKSIKKQATSPVDTQAERAIEGLAKLQSDVQDWPNKTQNQVRSIVQQDLRQRPDMGRKDAWKNLLASKLMNAGVSESNAITLSDLVWRQHEINNMNREIKLIESAAENGSLGVIVEMIKNTPLQQQSTPEWRKEVIRQYLISAGLSEKQAESAARLYDNIIAEKIAEAKQKAFEQSISKTSPWKDHMSRNGQLAKDALKKVLNAVRTSALDPTQNTESIIAKQNGWTGFSESDFRRIAEIDEILNDKETDDLKKSEVMKELNDIISKTKLPVTVKQALAAYYTGQALMGVPTVTVNIFSPLGFSLRNLFTDIARFGLTDPTRIPLAFDTFLESMRGWYNQTKYAFKNEVYPNDVVEYLNGNNVLKELYNKGKNEWKKGNYATGLRDMLIGSTQITGRVLSTLDQGAISALENQAVSRYAIEAMSLTNIPRSQRNVAAQKILESKRNTYASLIASGMEKDRAGVLSDMEMKKEVLYQLSSLNINPEKIQEVIDSSINDALLSVGRNRTISMDGLSNEQKRLSDSGMLSYLPIKFLEQMASNAAQQGPLMQIFSKMLYGFALVPARTFHNAAWYSPYGFLRIFRDKYQKSRGMESSYGLSLGNELQYRQRLTESIAGSVAMIGLAALAASSTDDDDDKKLKIVVTGNGPDAVADRQYYDSWIKKWKPNSVHIVMGDTIIPINIGRGGEAVFFPIMLAGALDDWNIRNKMNKAKKKPADLNQATVMLGSAFLALAQRGPYAAFGKPLFNATRAGQLPEELAAQAGYFGKTFIPIVGTSLARNISDLINDPIDKSSMSGAIYSNIPIAGPMIGTKALNALGQPIRADDWGDRLYRLGVPMVFSFPKNSPENTLNDLILSKGDGPAIPTRRNVESKMERALTNEEFYAYVKTYGDSVSKSMFRHRNSLARMDSSRYQLELEDYSKAANERAARTVKRMSMK